MAWRIRALSERKIFNILKVFHQERSQENMERDINLNTSLSDWKIFGWAELVDI